MMLNLRQTGATVAIGASLVLVGCGGGDSVSVAPPTEPAAIPASVTTSVSALLGYARESLGLSSDTAEPATMVNGALATDDAGEPSPL